MEMCSPTALEPRSLKSRCRQGSALSEGLQGRVPPCLLVPGCPTVLGGPWLRDGSLQSLPPSAPGLLLWVSLFFSVSYKEMLRGFRGYPNPTSLHLQRLYSQIRSHPELPGDMNFWRLLLHPLHVPNLGLGGSGHSCWDWGAEGVAEKDRKARPGHVFPQLLPWGVSRGHPVLVPRATAPVRSPSLSLSGYGSSPDPSRALTSTWCELFPYTLPASLQIAPLLNFLPF